MKGKKWKIPSPPPSLNGKKVTGFFFCLFEFCDLVLEACLGSLESGIELLQNSG